MGEREKMPSSFCPAIFDYATKSQRPIRITFRCNSMSHFLLRDLTNKSVTWEKVSFTSIGGKGKKIYVKGLSPPSCCIKESSNGNNHLERCPKGLKFLRFLREFFGQCGLVADIFLFFEDQKYCAATVVYASNTGARRSLKELDGTPLNGRSILVMKPKQHFVSDMYIRKQERQIINLANVIFGLNWTTRVLETTIVPVDNHDNYTEGVKLVHCIACKTIVQVNVKSSPTILKSISVTGEATHECSSTEKFEAVRQSRIESKALAFIRAFEKIVVAASPISDYENSENVYLHQNDKESSSKTQNRELYTTRRLIIPILRER